MRGNAPAGGGEWIQASEVQSASGVRHLLVKKGMSGDRAGAFRDVREAIVAVYNNVYQAQSVEADPGESVFQAPQYSKQSRD